VQGATIVDQIVSIIPAENFVRKVEEVLYIISKHHIVKFMGLALVVLNSNILSSYCDPYSKLEQSK